MKKRIIAIEIFFVISFLFVYVNISYSKEPEIISQNYVQTSYKIQNNVNEENISEEIKIEPALTGDFDEEIEENEKGILNEETNYRISITQDEIDLMARVVMSESSTCQYAAKQAVAETIVNRVIDSKYPNNVTEVINQPNQFSKHDNGKPTQACYDAVYDALENQIYCNSMFWFRSDKFHKIGYEYMQIDNLYFSTREIE